SAGGDVRTAAGCGSRGRWRAAGDGCPGWWCDDLGWASKKKNGREGDEGGCVVGGGWMEGRRQAVLLSRLLAGDQAVMEGDGWPASAALGGDDFELRVA
ncbi:hypothetical protein Dimus_022325, partial [Dionaea muscipula]